MIDKRFNRKKKIKALINDPYYQPMKQREIGYLMQVAPEDRDEFVEILNELVEEGSIEDEGGVREVRAPLPYSSDRPLGTDGRLR